MFEEEDEGFLFSLLLVVSPLLFFCGIVSDFFMAMVLLDSSLDASSTDLGSHAELLLGTLGEERCLCECFVQKDWHFYLYFPAMNLFGWLVLWRGKCCCRLLL